LGTVNENISDLIKIYFNKKREKELLDWMSDCEAQAVEEDSGVNALYLPSGMPLGSELIMKRDLKVFMGRRGTYLFVFEPYFKCTGFGLTINQALSRLATNLEVTYGVLKNSEKTGLIKPDDQARLVFYSFFIRDLRD